MHQIPDYHDIDSKTAVILAYANWEGFYNDCVNVYINFLRGSGKKICETDWMLLTGALGSEFQSLRDRHHSEEAKRQFVFKLKENLEYSFNEFDVSIISARSNLNFDRITYNYNLMNFDISSLQKSRIRLDQELVKWRHAVAHGDSPNLSAMDIASHLDFAAKLLLEIADNFQSGILERE